MNPFFKFIYRGILPILFGFIIGYVVPRMYGGIITEQDFMQVLVMILILCFAAHVIHESLYKILFGVENTLVRKMMKCNLRKELGLDYCVRCPDSYICANELKWAD